MSRHPQKTTVAAKFVYAKKANIGSLRAKSLTVADPLPTLNAKSIVSSGNTQTQTIDIGDKQGLGQLSIYGQGSNGNEIVILGKWEDSAGTSLVENYLGGSTSSPQLTIFRKGAEVKMRKNSFQSEYYFGFSKNTAIQGDLILGDLTGDDGANKTIHLGKVSLYNKDHSKRRNLFVNKAGKLCIGNEDPDDNTENEIQTIKLDTNGSPLPQSSNSDDRLKHNETEIKNATATLAKLKPYVYDMTQTFLPADYKGPLDEKKTPYRKESGFIAQEIQQIPELEHLVVPGDETTPFRLNYNGFLAFLVEGFQEMSAEIKALKAKVQSLEAASASS